MIDDFHTAEIGAGLSRRVAHFVFAAKDCDFCESLADSRTGGNDRTRVFTLRQNDVLRVRRRALMNLVENGHDDCQ